MNIRISLSNQESDRITAFFQQLACYEHDVELIFTKSDLLNQEEPPTIDNLPLPTHHLSLVNRVLYEEGKRTHILYEREVNKFGIRRKQHE